MFLNRLSQAESVGGTSAAEMFTGLQPSPLYCMHLGVSDVRSCMGCAAVPRKSCTDHTATTSAPRQKEDFIKAEARVQLGLKAYFRAASKLEIIRGVMVKSSNWMLPLRAVLAHLT